MTRGEAMLHRLRRGLKTSARTFIVTAHPDDETFGLGGSLGLMQAASIVQLTDGAAGVTSAETRRAERFAAFAAAGWSSLTIFDCFLPDQGVYERLADMVHFVCGQIAGADVVFTHPYEGGHPDHDAAAFIVQLACNRLGALAPDRLEFASYHFDGRRRVAGAFWPVSRSLEWCIEISGDRLHRKQRAIAAYASQANVARWFTPAVERYRVAPGYDFHEPPTTPACLYERKRWPLTNADLRAAMARCA